MFWISEHQALMTMILNMVGTDLSMFSQSSLYEAQRDAFPSLSRSDRREAVTWVSASDTYRKSCDVIHKLTLVIDSALDFGKLSQIVVLFFHFVDNKKCVVLMGTFSMRTFWKEVLSEREDLSTAAAWTQFSSSWSFRFSITVISSCRVPDTKQPCKG